MNKVLAETLKRSHDLAMACARELLPPGSEPSFYGLVEELRKRGHSNINMEKMNEPVGLNPDEKNPLATSGQWRQEKWQGVEEASQRPQANFIMKGSAKRSQSNRGNVGRQRRKREREYDSAYESTEEESEEEWEAADHSSEEEELPPVDDSEM